MLVAMILMSQSVSLLDEQPERPLTVAAAVQAVHSEPHLPAPIAIANPESMGTAPLFSSRPLPSIRPALSAAVMATPWLPQEAAAETSLASSPGRSLLPSSLASVTAEAEAIPASQKPETLPESLPLQRQGSSAPVVESLPDQPLPDTLVVPEVEQRSQTEPAPSNQSSSQSSTNDIFEDVFGRPQNTAVQQVIAPIILNNQSAGQVLVIVPGGNQVDVLVATDDFLAAVTDALRSDIAAQLAAVSQPNGTLNLRSIRELGIAINFDSRRLELQVSIPAALRQTAVLDVNSANVPPELAHALPPSRMSGYLNLRGGQDIVWSGAADTTGRQPFRLNFDGAVNLDGWVLEGSLNFTEAGSPAWQRGPIRVVHDDIASAVRYQIGDLAVPMRGYQASLPMVGVGVARNFALQPFRVTRPVSRFEFFLERPSTIEVFINGQAVQTLRLDPGPQDIRNLPLNAGINGVQLVVTDDLGRVERLDFATGVSGDLLAPGVQQFAYSLGFPAEGDSPSSAPQAYDFSQPVLNLSHRFGVNDTLTLGAYFQGDLSTQLVGIEGTWATTIGNIGWDAALSLDQDSGIDGAARLYYDWLFQGATSTTSRSLRLSAEYRGLHFMTVAAGVPNNSTGLDLSLAYSQTIFRDTRVTLSGRYQFTRDQPSDAYSLTIGLAKPIARGLTLNVSASYGLNDQGQTEPSLFVGISAALPRQRQFVNASTTLGSDGLATNRVNWSYSPPVTFEGISTALTATTSDRTINLLSQTRYRGYRADFSLDHSIDIPQGNSNPTVQTTRFTWGTALAFADGVWGWSRPIDNSFAIIARQGTAHDQVVQINPGVNGDIARADAFGSAVVPLSPYALTTLVADAPSLPQGSELGESRFGVFPTYRSGTLIRVGTDATVLVRGVLVDEQGNPVALQYGRMISLTDPNWPAVEVFTNRTGRFAAPGLKPGQYEIWMLGRDRPLATVDIPIGTTGVYTLELRDRTP